MSLIFEIISQLDLSEKKFKEKDWKGLIVAVSDCLTGGNLSSVLEKAKNDNILQKMHIFLLSFGKIDIIVIRFRLKEVFY